MCYCIWNYLYDNNRLIKPRVKVADVKANLDKALETGENPFEWLWKGLPATEKLVTSILANKNFITSQELEQLLKDKGLRIRRDDQQRATDVLKEWDVIESFAEDKFRFRVELFHNWIAKYKPLSKVQRELDGSEYQAHNFYQAGYKLLVIDQLDLAIENLEKAIKLNPNHVGATSLLIDIYLGKQNWEKAWKTAKALSLLRPIDARPLLSESLEGLIAGQDEETQLRYYEDTLKIDPEHAEVKEKWQKILKRQGYTAYIAGDLEKALDAYQKAGLNEKAIFIKQIIKDGVEMVTIPNGIKNATEQNIEISRWPITIYQYKKYRGSKGYDKNIRDNENREDMKPIINLTYFDPDGGEFYPDIYHYLEWLKQEYQTEYRLPTKEEWLYAKENGLIETVPDLYEWTSSSFNDNNEILELVSVNLEDDWSYIDNIKDNSTFRIIKKVR